MKPLILFILLISSAFEAQAQVPYKFREVSVVILNGWDKQKPIEVFPSRTFAKGKNKNIEIDLSDFFFHMDVKQDSREFIREDRAAKTAEDFLIALAQCMQVIVVKKGYFPYCKGEAHRYLFEKMADLFAHDEANADPKNRIIERLDFRHGAPFNHVNQSYASLNQVFKNFLESKAKHRYLVLGGSEIVTKWFGFKQLTCSSKFCKVE